MENTINTNTETPPRATPRSLLVVLWTMCFVLVGALVSMIAPRAQSADFSWLPTDAAVAHGAVVSQTGGLTVMTTDVGNEDLLMVLDSRNEELFVYRTDAKAGMQLLQRYPVPQMFMDARGRSQGR